MQLLYITLITEVCIHYTCVQTSVYDKQWPCTEITLEWTSDEWLTTEMNNYIEYNLNHKRQGYRWVTKFNTFFCEKYWIFIYLFIYLPVNCRFLLIAQHAVIFYRSDVLSNIYRNHRSLFLERNFWWSSKYVKLLEPFHLKTNLKV